MRVHPALLALASLAACSDPVAPATIDVRVITTDSRDPFDATSVTRVTLELAQDGAEPVRVVEDVDDDFDLGLVLRTLVDRTRTRVVLEGPDGVLLHGASPPFVPLASGGLVRILVGAPGTCELVPRAILPTARTARGHAVADTFAILVGGLDAEGAISHGITSIDLLRFDALDDQAPTGLPALVGAGGRARVASFGTSRLAIVSELGAVVYDLGVFEGRETPLTLHDGADPTSAVGSVDTAAVIAGGSRDAAATWLTVERRLIPIELAVARQHAVLADVGGVALVAGGMVGDPPGELLRPTSPTSGAVEGPDDGVRRSPLLLVEGTRALLVGGLDAEGAVRTDTVLFEGCPDCRASVGPEWTSARPGVVATGPFLVGGDRVERWTDEGFVEHTRLATPRRDALVTHLESDILVVAGGENDEDPLRDVELCFPTTLPPL